MKAAFRLGLQFVAILFFAAPIYSASFRVPTDENLVKRADAIVRGVVLETHCELDSVNQIVTVSTIRVDEVLKGSDIHDAVSITELGGIVGNRGLGVSGSATYLPGETVLVFLKRTESGFRTWGMVLGKFSLMVNERGSKFAVRGSYDEPIFGFNEADWTPFEDRPRDAERFLRFVREISKSDRGEEDYFVESLGNRDKIRTMNHFPAGVYTRGSDQLGTPTRRTAAATYQSSGTPTAEQLSAATFATNVWAGDAQSDINISHTGMSSNPFSLGDNFNTIVFNVSASDPNLGGTTVGFAQWSFFPPDGSNVKNGTSFGTIVEGDIKIETGLTGNALRVVTAHEVGHTLGFRHANLPFPGEPSGSGIMSTPAPNVTGLQPWDREAANHVYGDGTLILLGGCTNAAISAHPANQTITAGNNATLSVTATGTAPLAYQWFIGTSGNTTSPIAGATNSSVTVNPGSTTSYWVRVTNCSGAGVANSNTATVTVNPPPVCTAVSIIQHPQNRLIEAGSQTALSVTAGGTPPFTYQWFIGASGDTGNPVAGGTSQQLFVSPATTTTYWVRVGGCNSSFANSNAATVTVSPPVCPTITSHPQNTTIQSGQTATLVVSASGTSLTIEWFRGNSGDTSSGVVGTGASFTTPALTESTRFWARVRNSCGTVNSNAALVTVAPACPAGRLCLLSGRFEVNASWRDPNGNTGAGSPVSLTSDSGYFTFFSAANIEVVLKVLNGCPVNGRFWVFAAGLTNVQVDLVVRDTQSGASKTYSNPLGTAFQPIQDTAAFQTCSGKLTAAEVDAELVQQTTEELIGQLQAVNEALTFTDEVVLTSSDLNIDPFQGCTPSETTMCLAGNRFRVQATFAIPDGTGGTGKAVRLTDDSGYFWFFNPDNVEIVTKVLNACIPAFNRYWVFSAGLTNVQVNLIVTDTQTGAVRQYNNPQGTAYAPIQDTDAFATCP